jgi:hypothetical protein
LSRLRLAPLAICALHASLGYGLVAVHCHLRDLGHPILDHATTRVLLYLLTVAALVAVAAVALVSYRAWLASTGAQDPNGRRRFTTLFTALLSCVVAVYLVWSLVLISAIDLC